MSKYSLDFKHQAGFLEHVTWAHLTKNYFLQSAFYECTANLMLYTERLLFMCNILVTYS